MPLGESFLSSIKSNKAIMLDKSKRFKKTMGGFDKSKKQQFNFPKATPEQLRAIKVKMIREQKQAKKKQILTLLIIILALFFLFIFK